MGFMHAEGHLSPMQPPLPHRQQLKTRDPHRRAHKFLGRGLPPAYPKGHAQTVFRQRFAIDEGLHQYLLSTQIWADGGRGADSDWEEGGGRTTWLAASAPAELWKWAGAGVCGGSTCNRFHSHIFPG